MPQKGVSSLGIAKHRKAGIAPMSPRARLLRRLEAERVTPHPHPPRWFATPAQAFAAMRGRRKS